MYSAIYLSCYIYPLRYILSKLLFYDALIPSYKAIASLHEFQLPEEVLLVLLGAAALLDLARVDLLALAVQTHEEASEAEVGELLLQLLSGQLHVLPVQLDLLGLGLHSGVELLVGAAVHVVDEDDLSIWGGSYLKWCRVCPMFMWSSRVCPQWGNLSCVKPRLAPASTN